ncbi:hypothetical protein [Paenibacillus flagellatus]|uniref:Uncharacterized protein n=1 Tax=Paenibacillus flagellatus TaxID=2211139 RepID=A0A2V5K7Y8_9BACL|nr:hypothetical protein [Paenibacillus flagellatus]PYI53953.1 hypothetical protein DLM86_15475 [Paenibacillus flagellatus]
MKNYQELMNLKFGEVVTEEQFEWLHEIVFLSVLEEVLSSSGWAHRKEGEGPYPERFGLLNRIFGTSPKEFEERLESFAQHIQRKGKLGK